MSEQNLTALKTLVISMGVLLVVGFLVVGAAAWMKLKGGTAPKASAGSFPSECLGGTLDLKGRGPVIDSSVEGTTMRMAVANPDGTVEMIHIDICSGKEVSSLKILTDPRPGMGMPAMPPQLGAMPPQMSLPPESPQEPVPEE